MPLHLQQRTQPYVSVPFLDTLVTTQHNGTLATSVYMKPTHTDQYLELNSHHHKGPNTVLLAIGHRARAVFIHINTS